MNDYEKYIYDRVERNNCTVIGLDEDSDREEVRALYAAGFSKEQVRAIARFIAMIFNLRV